MRKVIAAGKELIEKGEDFVIAKVVDTQGSTPRKKGAWLLMQADGTKYGTVGGGILEANVERECLNTFKTKENKIYHYRLTAKEHGGIDMRCGGDADISIEYVNAKENPEAYIDEFDIKNTVYIFGAGHVAKAIAPILKYVDFGVVVLDDRADYANVKRYPQVDGVKVLDSFDNCFDGLPMDENSYVIIVTRGHAKDYDVLIQALELPVEPAYIGMIGSKRKVAVSLKQLAETGIPQEKIDRVYSPIGMSIFAETPEEIAISVVGEMIKVRSGHGDR